MWSKPGAKPTDAASEGQEDFARMLEDSLAARFHEEGETVEGTIVALGTEVAFVDIGGKGEATIDLEELADPDSDVQVKVGDKVRAVVRFTAITARPSDTAPLANTESHELAGRGGASPVCH
jgi:S1 RNA binding family protein